MNDWHFYAMAAMLILSATFSGGETAFFSLRPENLNDCRRRAKLSDRWLLALHADLANFLYTLLLGNLIVNTLYFTGAAGIAQSWYEKGDIGAAVFIDFLLLLLIIIGGEILPKSVGSALALTLCRVLALPLFAMHRLLAPIVGVIRAITAYFERALFPAAPAPDARENLRRLFEHYHHAGTVTHHEYSFISAVAELGAIRAREIMTPREDLATAPVGAPREEILAIARRRKHNKIPLRRADNEQLTGFIDARDVFFLAPNAEVKNCAQTLLVLSEYASAERALREFLSSGKTLATVLDERGADLGILTLIDIIGEIFGEFNVAGADE
ncbi:MAG: CNNM domain-containing protein [Planctomycetota bacterium]|jgi:CBS domain containing-hemolysin-like protein|nr:CNNM domain-containing protein [Planctomycetota bacterium]